MKLKIFEVAMDVWVKAPEGGFRQRRAFFYTAESIQQALKEALKAVPDNSTIQSITELGEVTGQAS